jgi:hypothetical protein
MSAHNILHHIPKKEKAHEVHSGGSINFKLDALFTILPNLLSLFHFNTHI